MRICHQSSIEQAMRAGYSKVDVGNITYVAPAARATGRAGAGIVEGVYVG